MRVRLRANTCKVRQAPGESGVKEGRGGQCWRRRRRWWRTEGEARGVLYSNCCIRPITRSTFVQEIHLSPGLTKEMSCCYWPVQ